MKLMIHHDGAPRWLRPFLPCLVPATMFLGGCATTPAPVDQIRFFSQAFVAVNTVGQPLLDEMAVAERVQGKRVAEQHAKSAAQTPPIGRGCASSDAVWALTGNPSIGYISGYCIEDASYYSTVGDPPATRQLRGGLKVIERYADVLTMLAEGRNLDQAIGEVYALSQEVSGLLALGGLNVALTPALQALQPVIAEVARNANAQEARRLIVIGAPKISALISALSDAAPDIFNTLLTDLRRTADMPSGATSAVREIESRRVLVSQYVVLLGRLQQAWDTTLAAVNDPGGSRLADVVARTSQVRFEAEAVRRSLAVLRMSTTP